MRLSSRRSAPARRLLGEALVLAATGLLACSGSSFVSRPEASQEEAKPSVARGVPAAVATSEAVAPAASDARASAPPLPLSLDPRRPRPALNPELHRLRLVAQQRVLGKESPPGLYALPYAPFDAASEPRDDSLEIGAALGNFVPVENEAALERFHEALRRLAAGQDADEKVRILAYGASHTQADVYPGYLRSYLQSRFGDGGQGFVLLGRVNKWYRTTDTQVFHRRLAVHHARYRLDVADEPLGLFGAALVGRNGGSFGEITTSKTSPNTRFEVHYFKQPGGGDFSIQLDGKRLARIATHAEQTGLGCHAFEASPGRHTIRAQLRGNGPVRLFGISAETASRGVVVDTLGIGGSQMVSNVRWQEETWIQALRQRDPDLVTFAYGTNEAMDESNTLESYECDLRAVLVRLRKATPEVSCLLIAPFELPVRALGPLSMQHRLLKIIDAQRRIAKEQGCAFWDGYAFMGGPGSMRRWIMAKPPLASTDRVHLTRVGYAYMGIAIADALMRAYDAEQARPSDSPALARPSTDSP